MPVNRSYPVILYVPTELTAEITFSSGVTVPLSAQSNQDLMAQAREVIAERATTLGGADLPVTIMDNSEAEPFMDFRLCTADAKMPKDDGLTPGDKKSAQERFAKWQKDLRRNCPRRPAPTAVATDRAPREPVPPTRSVTPGVMERTREIEDAMPRIEDNPRPLQGTWVEDTGPITAFREDGVFTQEMIAKTVMTEDERAEYEEQSAAADPFGMDTLMRYGDDSEEATMGWRGALNRMGLHLAPDADELAWRAALDVLSRPWDVMKKVAVVNERGGAGKTITAAMSAAAFHRANSWPVAGFDNNESGGNWHKRTGLNRGHQRTSKDLSEFYINNGGVVSRGDLAQFAHHHPEDHYSLFTAHRPYKGLTEHGAVTVQMTPSDVSNVYRALEDHFMLTITDSGNTLGAPNWEQMIVETDQLIVPVMTSADRDDGAVETLRVLNSYQGEFAELARNAIVAVSVWHRGDEREAKRLVERWTPHVRKVVVIPHDPRLNGGLQFSKLRPKTQLAFVQLAAAVAEALQEAA